MPLTFQRSEHFSDLRSSLHSLYILRRLPCRAIFSIPMGLPRKTNPLKSTRMGRDFCSELSLIQEMPRQTLYGRIWASGVLEVYAGILQPLLAPMPRPSLDSDFAECLNEKPFKSSWHDAQHVDIVQGQRWVS